MISFLLNEKIITALGICGFFTTQLLGSLKNNVLDPASHHILPHEMFNHGESFDYNKNNQMENICKRLHYMAYINVYHLLNMEKSIKKNRTLKFN